MSAKNVPNDATKFAPTTMPIQQAHPQGPGEAEGFSWGMNPDTEGHSTGGGAGMPGEDQGFSWGMSGGGGGAGKHKKKNSSGWIFSVLALGLVGFLAGLAIFQTHDKPIDGSADVPPLTVFLCEFVPLPGCPNYGNTDTSNNEGGSPQVPTMCPNGMCPTPTFTPGPTEVSKPGEDKPNEGKEVTDGNTPLLPTITMTPAEGSAKPDPNVSIVDNGGTGGNVPNPPTITPVPASNVCDEHGGIAYQGSPCVCPGVIDNVTICADGTKFDDPTTTSCQPTEQCSTGDSGGQTGGGEVCTCDFVCTEFGAAGCAKGGYVNSCTGATCRP